MMDMRLSMRRARVLTPEVINYAADRLGELVDRAGLDGLLLADLFLRAGKSHQDHIYSAALITNWAIAEKMLQEIWDRYLAANRERGGKPFIPKKRFDRLQDNRTFTASVVAETLSLVGELEYELYEKMSDVRQVRNNWIHSPNMKITRQDSEKSTDVYEQMLNAARGIDLIGQRGARIHG